MIIDSKCKGGHEREREMHDMVSERIIRIKIAFMVGRWRQVTKRRLVVTSNQSMHTQNNMARDRTLRLNAYYERIVTIYGLVFLFFLATTKIYTSIYIYRYIVCVDRVFANR